MDLSPEARKIVDLHRSYNHARATGKDDEAFELEEVNAPTHIYIYIYVFVYMYMCVYIYVYLCIYIERDSDTYI